MKQVDQHLAHIATIPATDLGRAWSDTFGEAAPRLPPSLLRRALAHAAQEQAFGGLSASARKTLEAMVASGPSALPELAIRLKPGTRLLREWSGTMHSVLVTEQGFEFDGKMYRSLSVIARQITGAHWSGPRFFGLKRPSQPPRQIPRHGQA